MEAQLSAVGLDQRAGAGENKVISVEISGKV